MTRDSSVPNGEPLERSPCFAVASALAAGIAVDHAFELPRLAVYAAAVLLTVALSAARSAPRVPRVVALLTLYGLVGAALHHEAWRDRGPGSVRRLLSDEPRLLRMSGVVAEPAVVDRRRDAGRDAAWLLEDRTRLVVDLEAIAREDGTATSASGRVQLTSAGHLVHVAPGDRIEATGWLTEPSGPRNPGGFDAAGYLRRRGLDAVLYVDHPDAVRRLESGGLSRQRLTARLRDRLSARFAENLSSRNGPVGAAMILGDRSAMPLDIRDAYVASGAMHILAISGLNVGILAVFLAAIGRLLNFSTATITVAVTCAAWAYSVLTNLEPPVVRASIFLTLWAASALLLRRTSILNTSAATAVLLLIWDPLLLFDVGAQLSFLAVLGMSWSTRALPGARRLFADIAEDRPRLATAACWLVASQMLSLGAWLFTAPLIAAEFQIVSPVGLLLNVVLVPLSTAVMWCGYAFFGACLVVPWAAGPFGAIFDFGLTAVNFLVVEAGEWRLGHLATPDVPTWWVAGFYALLFLSLLRPKCFGRRVRSVVALLAWTGVGLSIGLTPRQDSGLRLTVLDVGHGGAMLVETPGGRRLLFDCGSMEDDRRAAEVAWRAVRDRGGSAIDLLVISHADLDHCNNAPALFRGGPVSTTLVARSFLDLDQRCVTDACDAARKGGSRIRLVAAGDEVRLDPAVSIEVLHPEDGPPGEDDNANSIVLRIGYAGLTILLTGDLEGSGQMELFERERPRGHDVVTAPHHGGMQANTPEFAAWSRPGTLIVSCGRRVNVEAVDATYAETPRRLLTSRDGAVTVEIAPEGEITFDTYAGRW